MKTKVQYSMLVKGTIFFSTVFLFYFPVRAQEEGFYLSGTIPPRDSQTSPYLIDLSRVYTAPLDNDWLVSKDVNLQTLPKGVQTFANVKWDVRGIVQLAGTSLLGASTLSAEQKAKQYPQSVKGIAVRLKAEKIHFLEASSWGANNLQKVGEYVVHFANGDKQSIPLRYGEALIDWWASATAKPTNAEIAWHGAHAKSEISLFKYTWVNPSPQITIDSIDYVSAMSSASPFMIALTCDPGAAGAVSRNGSRPGATERQSALPVFDLKGRFVGKSVDRIGRRGAAWCTPLPAGVYLTHGSDRTGTVTRIFSGGN
jgi:hypothetical protein